MNHFHARVPTAQASRNMTRLCKHFRHKVSVDYDEREANAAFPFGLCRMRAEADALLLDCQAEPGEALARLQFVLADHLLRFSRDERLTVEWQDGANPQM
ncbi:MULTISPECIES: DUF2218 domain-containing protein [Pseudomonas]|uniref:DUF2218 domain-containing protein n=1 Tax=Pseudomonas kuykendallii TaxID=1007099 RepID=A0A2W5EMH1_9PSED|nr:MULTISPECIES: DUF2218 domain-containing protein [Pseudomonas]PZP21176.1 MAG: DUF2218 domain-containing protein [Pseudomonas kuykendallii]